MLQTLKQHLMGWGVNWAQFKVFIAHASGVSHDAMHVIAGVLAQLALAALFRSSIARIWPWALVLLAELANEWNDLHIERWSAVGMQWGEMAKDVGLTMFLPTLLLMLARWRPELLGNKVEALPTEE